MQPVFYQRDFILCKSAEPLPRDVRREKRKTGSVANVVLNQPVTQSPNDVLSLPQRKSVLEIEIVGVQVLSKRARDVSMRPVIIQLQFKVGVF